MFHTHGVKLVFEVHEQTLDLLWWWLFKHTHKHIIMVSPETDILKIELTIVQRRFEHWRLFFFKVISLTLLSLF